MNYDPRTEPHNLAHDPVTSLVVPRPIGWISTLSPQGVVNLGPYSFFNLVSGYPPWVIFSSAPRKHSQTNAELTGEFVFNLATWDLREQMNASSAEFPADVGEPDAVGLEMVPSRNVKPPRVKRSPVAMECKYYMRRRTHGHLHCKYKNFCPTWSRMEYRGMRIYGQR